MSPRQAGLLLAGITAIHLLTALNLRASRTGWCGYLGCPCKGSGE